MAPRQASLRQSLRPVARLELQIQIPPETPPRLGALRVRSATPLSLPDGGANPAACGSTASRPSSRCDTRSPFAPWPRRLLDLLDLPADFAIGEFRGVNVDVPFAGLEISELLIGQLG